MGFLKDLFSNQGDVQYVSKFPDKVKGLTQLQKSRFDWIAIQYKRLSTPSGNKATTHTTQLEGFFNRYKRARENRIDLDVFFDAEEEALEIFKKKNNQESPKEKIEPIKNIEKEIQPLPQVNDKYIFLKKYQKLFIHDKAKPIIEYLQGALVDFSKKYNEGLLQTAKVVAESEYHQIIYEVVYSLEDFTVSRNKILPFIFSQYAFELDKETRNSENLEKEILIKAAIVFDKIKKIIHWSARLNLKKLEKNPFYYIMVNGQRLDFQEFFHSLRKDINSIIEDFHLNDIK